MDDLKAKLFGLRTEIVRGGDMEGVVTTLDKLLSDFTDESDLERLRAVNSALRGAAFFWKDAAKKWTQNIPERITPELNENNLVQMKPHSTESEASLEGETVGT